MDSGSEKVIKMLNLTSSLLKNQVAVFAENSEETSGKGSNFVSLVRHLSPFDPREMIVEKLEHNKTQLKSIFRTFIEANRVSAAVM